MRVLLFSILLYLTGVTVLLYLRPSYMFKEDGSWKEFSTQSTEDGTPFPIWAFCIVWAFVSFAVVKAVSYVPSVNLEKIPLPPKVSTEAPSLKPGYYLLNREGSAEEGVPRYVYIGENAPQGRPEVE